MISNRKSSKKTHMFGEYLPSMLYKDISMTDETAVNKLINSDFQH